MARVCATGLGLAALLSAAAAATSNVTYEPKASMTQWVSERTHSLAVATKNRSHSIFEPRSSIRDLIDRMTPASTKNFAEQLSGEADGSFQQNRVSTNIGPLHPFGIDLAIKYVEDQMLSFGFEVELHPWRADYAPNVISCLRGVVDPSKIVILGAHLDDIPATGRAPGANDDGSGSAALLEMAKALHGHKSRFNYTLCLEHYTGEEQGLLGSRAQAALRKSRRDDVVAMIQQDMTAYHQKGDDTGMAFVQDSKAVSPELTQAIMNLAREYADPDLVVHEKVLSGSSCCSDHQSYAEQGYPAAGLIEPRGYTGDREYHQPGDLVNRPEYDAEQITYAGQVSLAAAASFAHLIVV